MKGLFVQSHVVVTWDLIVEPIWTHNLIAHLRKCCCPHPAHIFPTLPPLLLQTTLKRNYRSNNQISGWYEALSFGTFHMIHHEPPPLSPSSSHLLSQVMIASRFSILGFCFEQFFSLINYKCLVHQQKQ